MRSPSPLVLSGQPMSFEAAGVDSTPLNMVPAHHFLHPQLIYPHYLRDSMGGFIPPSNIKYYFRVSKFLLNNSFFRKH